MEHRGYGASASAYSGGLVQDSRVSKEKVTWLILSRYLISAHYPLLGKMTDLNISLFHIAYIKSIVDRIVFEEYQIRA